MKDEIGKFSRVKAHHKRKCPHCDSNKWQWLGAVSTPLEELAHYLLVRYSCEKCGNEFLVEEAKKTRYVENADKCVRCNSPNIEKTSKPDADIELFRCRKCNAYMAIGDSAEENGPIIVDLDQAQAKKTQSGK